LDDLAALARTVLDRNRYMTLATASAEGEPWASRSGSRPTGNRELQGLGEWGVERVTGGAPHRLYRRDRRISCGDAG
jgi:hypothetical protein